MADDGTSSEIAAVVDRICAEHDWSDERVWTELVATGLARAGFAESAGGEGGDLRAAAAVAGAAAANGIAAPVAEQAMLAGWLVEQAGMRLPPGLATVATTVGAEQEARLDDGGRFVGRVREVPWGRAADHVVVVIAEPDGSATRLALVATGDVPAERAVNLAGEPRDDLDLSGVRPAVVGTGPAAELVEARAALARAVQIAATLSAVADMTLRYTATRHQFGRPLLQLDPVRQQLAVMTGEVQAVAAAVDTAVQRAHAGARGLVAAAAAAKVRAGAGATAVARIAHQLHGAIGTTAEYRLHRLTTRLWAWREEYGSDAYWAGQLFSVVHRAGPGPLWPELVAI